MALFACGGSSTETPIGRSVREPDARAIEMSLRRPNGDWIHLGDLRGKPVLLFVFATFDGISQASLRPLQRFARDHRDIHIIGIAAQPDANQLLDPYERALAPRFPLTYDPARDVHHGTSPLGAIRAVPTFIMYDARGLEVDRHIGFPSSHTLPRLRDRAIRRGGITSGETEDVPLLAE